MISDTFIHRSIIIYVTSIRKDYGDKSDYNLIYIKVGPF